MKKILSIILFTYCSLGFSQTNFSGAISSDTTWSLSNSPYIVTGNVLVASGVTLTIEAGVTIKVSSSAVIQNNGTLIAIGTSSDKITFTSNESSPSAGDWKYIFFSNTSVDPTYDGSGNYLDGSTLQYVDILYGGSDTSKGAIDITDSSLYLKNIIVKNSASYGVHFSKSSGGSVGVSKIISSEISNNSATGVYCNCYQYNKSITVENSTINNNAGYGISTGGGDAGGTHIFNYKNNIITNNSNSGILANANGTQNIYGNIIYNNTGYGVRSRGNGTYTIEKNIIVGNNSVGVHGIYATHIIDNNVIANNAGGIEVSQGGNYTVSDNQIVFNNNSGDGSGFDPYGGNSQQAWSPDVSLTRNTFYSNTSTFSTILSFQPQNGDPSFVLNNNNIYKNISSYEFKNYRNSSTSTVDAENNYWGTATESEIQSKIFDWSDDGSYGIVDYTPFSTSLNTDAPISPPSNVTKSVSGSDIVLSWSANAESDLAGYKLHYGDPSGYSYTTTIDLGNTTSYTLPGGDIATEYAITAYDSSLDGTDDMVDGNESWFSVSKEVKVTLTSSATSISEPTNSATLTATLDNTSSADVVVNITYTGTATNATDYSGAASITVFAGSLTGTTAITAIDDTDVELTETIIIDMGDVSGAAENGTQQVTISLTDNDLPSVSSIALDKTYIDENGGVAVITATISAVQSKYVTIPLTITGTASADTDYSSAFSSKDYSTVAGGNIEPDSLNNQFNNPYGIDVDALGNMYIADRYNHRIVKWEPGATEGVVVAGGNGNGSANNQLSHPFDVEVDVSGNLFITDVENHRVMKWAAGGTTGTVVAGSGGSGNGSGNLYYPYNSFLDSSGNLYVADHNNHRIMKWAAGATTGIVVAGGNGQGSGNNQFNYVNDVFVDSSGNIYVSDVNNHRVMKWAPGATEGTVVAGGNGQGAELNQFYQPYGLYIDSDDNLFVSDSNNRVMKWKPGAVSGTLVAGTNVSGSELDQLAGPRGINVDSYGNLYISDSGNNRIQKITFNPEITIPAGSTTGTFTVTGIQDSNEEDNETIIITPSTSPTNATSSISDALTVTIFDKNLAPVATAQTNVEATEQTEVTITLAGTDSNSDTLTYIIATLPTNGTLSDNDSVITVDDLPKTTTSANVVYISISDTATSDSFTFKVNDGTVDSETATVSLAITAVNDVPSLSDDSVSTDEDNSIDITLNASDLDSSQITYSVASDVSNGTVTITNNIATYAPSENFNGADSFTVTANDGEATSNIATISITVNAVNDAPVAVADTATVDEGNTSTTLENGETSLLHNDTDTENDPLTAILVSDPIYGSLTLNSDGTFSYEHNGSGTTFDNFTYKSNDGFSDSNITTVNITINPINDNFPTNIILSNTSVEENLSQVLIGELSVIDLDLPSDSHTFQLVNGDGDDNNSNFTISGKNLTANDAFDYETQQNLSIRIKVVDENAQFFEKSFTINVVNVNDINITYDTIDSYCSGDSGTGSITITSINDAIGTTTFSWSATNGAVFTGQESNQNLTELSDGIYSLTLSDDDFTFTKSFEISLIPQYDELSICYISSDENDAEKNRIFLNNQGNYNVDVYEILRETNQSDVYESIGTLESNENSFLDDTSNNTLQSYNYKVRLLDNCENVSSESISHKTILLQSSIAVNNSVNLSWSDYEGISYSTYNIYRKLNEGSFEVIGSVSSNNNSYNDQAADVSNNNYEYYIAIGVDACNVQAKNSNSEQGKKNTSVEIKSNIQNVGSETASVEDENSFNNLSVYPNPTKNILFIKGNELPVQITIYNILGQELISVKNTNKIDVEYLSTGVYTIKISDGTRLFKGKFIKD